MDNKKLLKFLYKDIAEIEELVTEKGTEGFDEFEVEFIQSRFKGAKQLIQILSEKENKQLNNIRPRPVEEESVQSQIQLAGKEEEKEPEPSQPQLADVEKGNVMLGAQLSVEEVESINSLSEFEEELKESVQSQSRFAAKEEEEKNEPLQPQSTDVEKKESEPSQFAGKVEEEESEQLQSQLTDSGASTLEEEGANDGAEPSLEPEEDEAVVDEANHRLGDSFSKEKSVNELLGNNGSRKLEYKISNSPVESIKTAIGINDRYQYIRELFDGNGETFSKTVAELDNMATIQEAVTYLQQNYKWKKNDTSLKFVNLVKRRFPNG